MSTSDSIARAKAAGSSIRPSRSAEREEPHARIAGRLQRAAKPKDQLGAHLWFVAALLGRRYDDQLFRKAYALLPPSCQDIEEPPDLTAWELVFAKIDLAWPTLHARRGLLDGNENKRARKILVEDAKRSDVEFRLAEGKTYGQIARALNWSRTRVAEAAKRWGIAPRSRKRSGQ